MSTEGSGRQSSACWRIAFADAELLSGSSTGELIDSITHIVEADYVVIEEPDWLPDVLKLDQADVKPTILETVYLLEKIDAVSQFDWFCFVFFNSKEAAARCTRRSYHDQIAESVFLLRGVDNTYYYIYTVSDAIAEYILATYPDAEHARTSVEEVAWPY